MGERANLKKIGYIVISVLFLAILIPALDFQTAKAQVTPAPSVRYLNIEYNGGNSFTITWAVYYVANWGDKINFSVWIIRGSDNFLVGCWAIGLSNILYTSPNGEMSNPGYGIMGGYGGTEILINWITAESPFMVQQESNPIDGVQMYYFYETHVTFSVPFESGDTILLAADYNNQPAFYSGELPYYGPTNTGDYVQTTYDGITFTAPEYQYGILMALMATFIAFVTYEAFIKFKRKNSSYPTKSLISN